MSGMEKRWEKMPSWLLPALILLLGAGLRLAFLGQIPAGMHQDESIVAWNAYAMFHEGIDSAGHRFPIYMADWGDGHSPLYVWLTIPLIALNGGHVNSFISRLPQALVAILTLLAVYDLMRRMFNRKLGLWAMFLLAICPWHVMTSRWGLDVDLAPGFLVFGLYFFIRGLENKKYLLLSALCYGLVLYCYAVMWPVVPAILILQILYALYHKKLTINRYSISASILLFLLALPQFLFIMVNSELIPEISLPFITIPKMGGYRGGEVAFSLSGMWKNFRTALTLLWRQNTGAPQDILLPWGLYYDIGRVFIAIGVVCVVVQTIKTLIKKEFSYVFFLFSSLVGGGVNCLIVAAKLHQVDALFIPLLLCEAYGLYTVLEWVRKRNAIASKIAAGIAITIYSICLVLFQRDYYTDYQKTANAYLAAGIKECVEYALDSCGETGLRTITVEQGAQWSRLLLFTEVLPSDYLATVEYDPNMYPAPASFEYNGIRINTRINYDFINPASVYIIYFTDVPLLEADYDLTQFYDWYVAVPKSALQ